MVLHEVSPFRRRMLGIVLAGIGCSALVVLPAVGLLRIDRTTTASHHYTEIISSINQITNELLRLVTGPLTGFGTVGTPETRDLAANEVATLRQDLVRADTSRRLADEVGIGVATGAQLGLAHQTLDSIDSFIAEIDAGQRIPAAPSTNVVVANASNLLSGQGAFTASVVPVAVRLDAERRDAIRQAQILLGAAAVTALAAFGVFAVVDGRKVQHWFSAERAKRHAAETVAAHRADIVSMASHELRNPLTVLTLTTDLLSRAAHERKDEELAALATDAHAAAMRSETLVNELLDMGRLDADRLQLTIGATPFLPALTDALAMSDAHHSPHTVRIAATGEPSVRADPQRLRVILRNLIDNAFKYSPPGSEVLITIGGSGHVVSFEIRDQGAGVARLDRERIFEKFERLRATSDVPGVGIGLYLSRELARRMDGDLRCADSPTGARFCLDLPSVA